MTETTKPTAAELIADPARMAALVATEIHGWVRVGECWELPDFKAPRHRGHKYEYIMHCDGDDDGGYRPYDNIAQAMEVVEKLREDYLVMLSLPQSTNNVSVLVYDLGARPWGAREIFHEIGAELKLHESADFQIMCAQHNIHIKEPVIEARKHDELALAICLAALRAKGVIE